MTLTPIFIVSSERSGTNLLRTLLGNHSQIDAPVAPQFLSAWPPMLPYYGNLQNGDNMRQLLTDMVNYANYKFSDWGLDVDIISKLSDAMPNSFIHAFHALHLLKAKENHKSTYVSKDNNTANYAIAIKHEIEEAKFIYLVRDPRDVCASWKSKPLFQKTVWYSIKKWEKEQLRTVSLIHSQGVDMCFVKYEELIQDPSATISRILEYCNIRVEEACFATNPQKTKDEATRSSYWNNLNKPIIKGNTKKYNRTLSSAEVNMIETIAGQAMEMIGYDDFDSERDWTPPKGFRFRLKFEAFQSQRSAQKTMRNEAMMHAKRVKLQSNVLKRLREKSAQPL